MKKPASVHIDIAEFSMTVMELSVEERSDWLLSLVKCLSYADPTLNEYGAKLLNEVETYREAERKRKEKYSDKGKTRKDTERHGKTEIPKRDTTEQTDRTEQTVLKEKDTIVSKKKRISTLIAEKPSGVSDETWKTWVAFRQSHKWSTSQIVVNTLLQDCKENNADIESVLKFWIAYKSGWQGFRFDWLKPEDYKKVGIVAEKEPIQKEMKVVFSDDPDNIGYRNEK
jgi:hypothetical protein